jgi:hypothetical protein
MIFAASAIYDVAFIAAAGAGFKHVRVKNCCYLHVEKFACFRIIGFFDSDETRLIFLASQRRCAT